MEIIKEMVEVTKGYKATDGTFFKDESECRKYEESALVAAQVAADKLSVRMCSAETIFDEYMLCGEDTIRVFDIKDADQLQIINTYLRLLSRYNLLVDPSYIGQHIAIDFYAYDDGIYIIGNREEMEKKFFEKMDRLFGPRENAQPADI